MTEMHRRGLLRRGEVGHLLHIRHQRGGKLSWQRLARDLARIGLLVVHGQDEGAISPRRAVAFVEQGLKHLLGAVDLAGNTERGGIAVNEVRIFRSTLERGLVIPLRPGLITGHVARQPPVREQRRFAKAETRCLVEKAERLCRVLRLERDTAKPRLYPSIVGLDRVCPRKEARRRTRVIHVDCGLPCSDQRVNVARIGRQARQIAAEIFSA